MLRVLIVDDERLARVALRSLLNERDDVQIVGEADSVQSARDQLRALRPDVIFLDVQMPGGSGFELFTQELPVKVVFCTAYEQYAIRAFEVNALDYLVKPVSPEGIDRALRRLVAHSGPEFGEPLARDDAVALRGTNGLRFVSVRDLLYIQAADDYSDVHLVDGTSFLLNISLRSWESRLPATDFVRIHRSSLVNLSHLQHVRLQANRWHVSLRGGHSLPVSRRMVSGLKKRLRD